MPKWKTQPAYLLDHDAVWVEVVRSPTLLALWRLHGYDAALHPRAGRRCVVLAGVSAGSICWHVVADTTDSFGPDLRPVTDGLAFVPYSNGVHYDSDESQRRPPLPTAHRRGSVARRLRHRRRAGLLYARVTMVEAVSEMAGKGRVLRQAARLAGSRSSASKFACSPDRRADCALVLRQPTSARQQPAARDRRPTSRC